MKYFLFFRGEHSSPATKCDTTNKPHTSSFITSAHDDTHHHYNNNKRSFGHCYNRYHSDHHSNNCHRHSDNALCFPCNSLAVCSHYKTVQTPVTHYSMHFTCSHLSANNNSSHSAASLHSTTQKVTAIAMFIATACTTQGTT